MIMPWSATSPVRQTILQDLSLLIDTSRSTLGLTAGGEITGLVKDEDNAPRWRVGHHRRTYLGVSGSLFLIMLRVPPYQIVVRSPLVPMSPTCLSPNGQYRCAYGALTGLASECDRPWPLTPVQRIPMTNLYGFVEHYHKPRPDSSSLCPKPRMQAVDWRYAGSFIQH